MPQQMFFVFHLDFFFIPLFLWFASLCINTHARIQFTINGYQFVLNWHLSIFYKSMLIYKIVGVDFDLALGINLSAIDIFRTHWWLGFVFISLTRHSDSFFIALTLSTFRDYMRACNWKMFPFRSVLCLSLCSVHLIFFSFYTCLILPFVSYVESDAKRARGNGEIDERTSWAHEYKGFNVSKINRSPFCSCLQKESAHSFSTKSVHRKMTQDALLKSSPGYYLLIFTVCALGLSRSKQETKFHFFEATNLKKY